MVPSTWAGTVSKSRTGPCDKDAPLPGANVKRIDTISSRAVRIAWGQERLLFSSEGHHFEHLRFVGEGPHGEGMVLARRHPPRAAPCPRSSASPSARRWPGRCALGIVHRDVCPSNIRVSRGGQVKLTGFGVAWSSLPGREETTEDGEVLGDTDHAPPERLGAGGARHHHDAWGDLFCLGLVLLELVTGQHLSYGERLDRRVAHAST